MKPVLTSGYSTPTFGDVTGDGLVDLLIGNGTGEVALWRGTRKGEPRFERAKAPLAFE